MQWNIFLVTSASLFVGAILSAFAISKCRYKSRRVLTPNKLLIIGTYISSAVYLFPFYLAKLPITALGADTVKALLASLQHAIRLFAFDGGYAEIASSVAEVSGLYSLYGAVLYLFAPLLTFGIILSLFKNALAYRNYLFSFWKHTHVFSELNKHSLALACSILEKDKKERKFKLIPTALIVFTDVTDKNDENMLSLTEKAKELGAILFSKDLESIKYRTKYSMRKVSFYLISENEDEKFRHALGIMREYDYSGVSLRVFSESIKTELLLSSKSAQNMRIVRVNDTQSLVYHELDQNGTRLFENARDDAEYGKVISVVIVGLGGYGKEMLRALSWFCQLPGYRLKINAFDKDADALEKFKTLCPELMSDRYNRKNDPEEACYEINIHSGIDAASTDFFEKLKEIKDVTYVLVSLGNDDANLATAVRIRSAFSAILKSENVPDIDTVIYNSDIRNLMGAKRENDSDKKNVQGVCNHKNQYYNLHMIGDLDHFYSASTLLESELIESVTENMKGNLNSFWKYEYNYRSTIARAIYRRMLEKIGYVIPGTDKKWEDRTPEEKLAVGYVEHLRWNAYMRSEGYCFPGVQDPSLRNDLGKLHHNLVPVKELSDEDLKKDDY